MKIKILKYATGLILVIVGSAGILAYSIDDTPLPQQSTERYVYKAPIINQIKTKTKDNYIENKTVFNETDIVLPIIKNENQRLLAQRDVRQLIYPIYAKDKPFNARHNDSCYVSINADKISVAQCSNAVVKRFLNIIVLKYDAQFSMIFKNNQLKFKILLTFE